jgi:hypothetical protein
MLDPDPVVPLAMTLAQALREALQAVRSEYLERHTESMARLAASPTWAQLPDDQKAAILNRQGISGVPEVRLGTDRELLDSLADISLEGWATRRDALSQRFENARTEAATLLEPKAVRVALPSATLRNDEELRAWLAEVEAMVREQLDSGPVIV